MEIPSNASLGTHSYFVGIDGLEGQTEVTWDSTPEVIVVQDFWQDTYNDLLEQTSNNMSKAENKTYNSPDAQSYLQQAQSAYSNALRLRQRSKLGRRHFCTAKYIHVFRTNRN